MKRKERKVKKFNKGSFFVLFLAILCIGQYSLEKVKAENYDYSFVFDYEGQLRTLEELPKNTNSSVYMHCTFSEFGYGSYVANVWAWDTDDNTDFEASGDYTFYYDTTEYMKNRVVEDGGEYAYVKARLQNGVEGGIFYGRWRADL